MTGLQLDDPNQKTSTLSGVVDRITFHNSDNGWTVLRLEPFGQPDTLVSVVVHQAKIVAGASMEFRGDWVFDQRYGEQFKAQSAIEKKPATVSALERYLGSGLIKGVGPKIAGRIVDHFGEQTLEVFSHQSERLLGVPGIAEKKLQTILSSWKEHQAIREVMMFLQDQGVSTLLAVKIFKTYGDEAIARIEENPYCLAEDIYGIGFFTADKIALNLGVSVTGVPRLRAGVLHVLEASREHGHCFLTHAQVVVRSLELLDLDSQDQRNAEFVEDVLTSLQVEELIKTRALVWPQDSTEPPQTVYYARNLFWAEQQVFSRVVQLLRVEVGQDRNRMMAWVQRFGEKTGLTLSEEQALSVVGMAGSSFSILTGGPGCGKTTTTRVLVKLLRAMGKKVLLAAPTGRAAQRMSEVIGQQAKTVHRLLEWLPGEAGFKRNRDNPLSADFMIVDECSMLDVGLASALLQAVSDDCQVTFIGDPDQLPAVGPGQVLGDLIAHPAVPSFRLTQVFRQAQQSSIVRFAHQLNQGRSPYMPSPIEDPELWKKRMAGKDCLFVDADEATGEQAKVVKRITQVLKQAKESKKDLAVKLGDAWCGRLEWNEAEPNEQYEQDKPQQSGSEQEDGDQHTQDPVLHPNFVALDEKDCPDLQTVRREWVLQVPERYHNADIAALAQSRDETEGLAHLLGKVHPWSTIQYGMTGLQTVLRLYTQTIPRHFKKPPEIQVLAPQVRGSLGTVKLNEAIQEAVNPAQEGKAEFVQGTKLFRVGDRVIQKRNNYDLDVYNGDIGHMESIDHEQEAYTVVFGKAKSGGRQVVYNREQIDELSLAYAITVHKSQGSEFEVVILPIFTQHFNMLYRNLVYTGLTRAKKLCILVGSRKALAMAVRRIDQNQRQTALQSLLDQEWHMGALGKEGLKVAQDQGVALVNAELFSGLDDGL